MKGRPRPEPLAIPAGSKPAFKLSDSGVFEEGGLVLSKAGCTLPGAAVPAAPPKQRKQTDDTTSRLDALQINDLGECGGYGSCGDAPYCGAVAVASAEHHLGSPPACSSDSDAIDDVDADAPELGEAQHSPTPAAERRAAGACAAVAGAANIGPPRPQGAVALEDLQEMGVVGAGSGGVVKKVCHRPTGELLVLKVIQFDVSNAQLRRQVATELRSLAGARHPHVVAYRESYLADGAVTILMEFMDAGSLADLLARVPRLPERALAEVARQVVSGLAHLHGELRIVHRDIKPSNLLLSTGRRGGVRPGASGATNCVGNSGGVSSSNSGHGSSSGSGAVLKISDFGVSGQLSSSVSKCASWVGTVTYMSPERIRGDAYSFNTDIWSLGMVLVEAATGRFPYPPQGEGAAPAGGLGFWELLEYIVVEPAPRLPAGQFSPECLDFVHTCLRKDPATRPSAADLLRHPWLQSQPPADLGLLLGRSAAQRVSLCASLHYADGGPQRASSGSANGLLLGSLGAAGGAAGATAMRSRVRASGGIGRSCTIRSSGVLKLSTGSSGMCDSADGGRKACSAGTCVDRNTCTYSQSAKQQEAGGFAKSSSGSAGSSGATNCDAVACPTTGGLVAESSVIWGSSESPPAWRQPEGRGTRRGDEIDLMQSNLGSLICSPASRAVQKCIGHGDSSSRGSKDDSSSGGDPGSRPPVAARTAAEAGDVALGETAAPDASSPDTVNPAVTLQGATAAAATTAAPATTISLGPEAATVGPALGSAAFGARVTANLRYSGLRGLPSSSRNSSRRATTVTTGTSCSQPAAPLRQQQLGAATASVHSNAVVHGMAAAAAASVVPLMLPQGGGLVQPMRVSPNALPDEAAANSQPAARGLPRYSQQAR